jgi:hypothetical protein
MPPEETVMTRASGAAFSNNGITNSVKVYVAATLTEKLISNLLRRKQSTPFVNGLSYQGKLFVRTFLLYRPVFKLLREIIYKQQMSYPSPVVTRLCSSEPALLT